LILVFCKEQKREPCLQELSLLLGSMPRNVVGARREHSKDFSSLAEFRPAPFLHKVVQVIARNSMLTVAAATTITVITQVNNNASSFGCYRTNVT